MQQSYEKRLHRSSESKVQSSSGRTCRRARGALGATFPLFRHRRYSDYDSHRYVAEDNRAVLITAREQTECE